MLVNFVSDLWNLKPKYLVLEGRQEGLSFVVGRRRATEQPSNESPIQPSNVPNNSSFRRDPIILDY